MRKTHDMDKRMGETKGSRYLRTCVHNDVDEVHALGESVAQVDVVEGDDGALALGSFECLPPLKRLLTPHLVLVKLGEIVDNNGDGQRNYQYAANTAYRADDLAQRSRGVNVTVSDCGHGDAGPPEGFRNGNEFSPRLLLLGEVGKWGEYEHSHREEQHE